MKTGVLISIKNLAQPLVDNGGSIKIIPVSSRSDKFAVQLNYNNRRLTVSGDQGFIIEMIKHFMEIADKDFQSDEASMNSEDKNGEYETQDDNLIDMTESEKTKFMIERYKMHGKKEK
ncbi:MAG: hypothetical protein M1542_09145 [Thermotogae bacterium]|jgi:hypothetical protein|nr:hypothetical protein [Thermotogota bacterium]